MAKRASILEIEALLVEDAASLEADSMTADERKAIFDGNRLGHGSEDFSEEEEELVLDIFAP
jgi:hypothetical protein